MVVPLPEDSIIEPTSFIVESENQERQRQLKEQEERALQEQLTKQRQQQREAEVRAKIEAEQKAKDEAAKLEYFLDIERKK